MLGAPHVWAHTGAWDKRHGPTQGGELRRIMQYCMQLWKGCPYRPCQPIDRVLEAFSLWWDSCRGLVFVSCRGACL